MKKLPFFFSAFVIAWIAFGILSSAQSTGSKKLLVTNESTSIEDIARIERKATITRSQVENLSNSSAEHPNNSNFSQVQQEVVMDELIFHYRFLMERADDNARRGRNPQGLYEYYKRRLDLTVAEDNSLRQVLRAADVELRIMDDQLRAITQRYRDIVNKGLRPGFKPPDVHEEVRDIDSQRRLLLNQLPRRLREAMGEIGYSKLDSFVTSELSPRIRATMLQNREPSRGNSSIRFR